MTSLLQARSGHLGYLVFVGRGWGLDSCWHTVMICSLFRPLLLFGFYSFSAMISRIDGVTVTTLKGGNKNSLSDLLFQQAKCANYVLGSWLDSVPLDQAIRAKLREVFGSRTKISKRCCHIFKFFEKHNTRHNNTEAKTTTQH